MDSAAAGSEKIHDLDKETAGLLRRGIAGFIDGLLFLPIWIALCPPLLACAAGDSSSACLLNEPEPWRRALSNSLLFVYIVLMLGLYGRTVGMMALHIRITKLDGSDIGFGRALLRTVAYWIPVVFYGPISVSEIVQILITAFCVMGLMWIMVDRKHQGYHDKIANTLVMREEYYQERKGALAEA